MSTNVECECKFLVIDANIIALSTERPEALEIFTKAARCCHRVLSDSKGLWHLNKGVKTLREEWKARIEEVKRRYSKFLETILAKWILHRNNKLSEIQIDYVIDSLSRQLLSHGIQIKDDDLKLLAIAYVSSYYGEVIIVTEDRELIGTRFRIVQALGSRIHIKNINEALNQLQFSS